jgi:hypothetical protein
VVTLRDCIALYEARQMARSDSGDVAVGTQDALSGGALCRVQTPTAAAPASTFGALLRQYRLATPAPRKSRRFTPRRPHLSQRALARAVDVDESYISMLETGTRTPSRYMVSELASVLRIYGERRIRLLAAAGYAARARRAS